MTFSIKFMTLTCSILFHGKDFVRAMILEKTEESIMALCRDSRGISTMFAISSTVCSRYWPSGTMWVSLTWSTLLVVSASSDSLPAIAAMLLLSTATRESTYLLSAFSPFEQSSSSLLAMRMTSSSNESFFSLPLLFRRRMLTLLTTELRVCKLHSKLILVLLSSLAVINPTIFDIYSVEQIMSLSSLTLIISWRSA